MKKLFLCVVVLGMFLMSGTFVYADYGTIDNSPEEKERAPVTINDEGIRRAPVTINEEGVRRGILAGETVPENSIETPRAVGEIELPNIEIELPMTKGTVKFFNETKTLDGKIIDIAIKVNGQDV